MTLLRAVVPDAAPRWLRCLPAVDFLRRAWCQQYQVEDGIVRWRTSQNGPPGAIRLTTPHDPDADHVIRAHAEHGIDLVGPVPRDTSRHKSTESAFDNTRFRIDWDDRRVTCPGGNTSTSWKPAHSQRNTPVIRVRFAARDCDACPLRQHRTTSRYGRQLTLRPRSEHDVLVHARQQQETPGWRQRYRRRAGVEGTISQGVLVFGLRRSRYRGLGKTGLQHQLTAAAMDLTRINAWLIGARHSPTRTSHFAALRPAA